MGKRIYTDAFIKDEFEKVGYTITNMDYVNTKSRIGFVCDKGHEVSITWDCFMAGQRCGKCFGTPKKDIEFVRSEFKKVGFTLISNVYTDNKHYLDYVCSNGHRNSIRWDTFTSGVRCPDCRKNRRIGIEYIKKEFSLRGHTLLSTEYVNNHTELDYVCCSGHKGKITWNSFDGGGGCVVCSGHERLDLDKVKKEFERRGFTILDTAYVSSSTPLRYICSNGHNWKISYSNFIRGFGCPFCSGKNKKGVEEVIELLRDTGYSYISGDYMNVYSQLKFRCPEGHVFDTSYARHFYSDSLCPVCFNKFSRMEKDVAEYVGSVYNGSMLTNDRVVLRPKELDIYIPDKKLAIEFCGLHWHSEVSGRKPKMYHYNKLIRCSKLGIRLITIFEDEWLYNKEIVKSRISNALGCKSNTKTIYARKTVVKIIDTQTAESFLNTSHIQGYSTCKYRYGLFFNDELVQVMTFGSVSRSHSGGEGFVELKRLSSLPFVSVVGGASKLFTFAVNDLEEKGFSKVISYCDMRWANINSLVYEKLGFTLSKYTKYTPHYIKGNKRFRNQSLRKTPEERLTGKTEWELRQEQGYDRIWDCGHRTYVYEIRET